MCSKNIFISFHQNIFLAKSMRKSIGDALFFSTANHWTELLNKIEREEEILLRERYLCFEAGCWMVMCSISCVYGCQNGSTTALAYTGLINKMRVWIINYNFLSIVLKTLFENLTLHWIHSCFPTTDTTILKLHWWVMNSWKSQLVGNPKQPIFYLRVKVFHLIDLVNSWFLQHR